MSGPVSNVSIPKENPNIDNTQATQNVNGKNCVVKFLKNVHTHILEKLENIKSSISSKLKTGSKRNVAIHKSDNTSVASKIDPKVYNELHDKINLTKIKEDWQKDLIETRMNKGVDAWAESVVENLQKGTATLDKIFFRKEGIFNLDKLSPDELKALSDSLDKTSLKVKVSSELREMNIFSDSHLLNDYIYNIKEKISSEKAKVLSEASSLLFELKSLRNFLLLKNPDIDYSINNLKYTMSADIKQACKYSEGLNSEKAKEFLEKTYNDVKNVLSKGLEIKALNEEEYKDLLNSVEKQIEQAKSQKNL